MFSPDIHQRRVSCEHSCVRLMVIALGMATLPSCKLRSSSAQEASVAEANSEARDYFRSVLLGSVNSAQSSGLDLSQLMTDGRLTQAPPLTQFSVGKTIFSSLSIFSQHGIGSRTTTGGEILRAETFSMRGSLNSGVLKHLGRSLPFHLSLGAQAEIKVFRKFSNRSEAEKYPPYSFVELPITIENAKAMRTGDLVVIPLEAQVLGSVDGSFMRSVLRSGVPINKLLGSSFVGHVQSGLRANFIISGRFEMHILKTDTHIVRVRLFQQSEHSASGGAGGSAAAAFKYTLIPFAKLHQVSEIKRLKRVSFYGDKTLSLPDPLKQLSAKDVLAPGLVSETDDAQLDAELQQRDDGLVDLANAVSLSAEDIQRATTDKINSIVDTLNTSVVQKINQPIAEVKKYSDQELRFDAQLSWNESRKHRRQFFFDFQFDLQNTLAQQAFLHAVSGTSTFLTTHVEPGRVFVPGQSIQNYVLAERIARESALQSNPPVIRIVSASARSEVSDSAFQIQIGQNVRFNLSENWQRERYNLSNSVDSSKIDSAAMTRWVFNQGYKFGLVTDRQTRSGGVVSDISADVGEQPLFWLSHEFEARSPGGGHLARFLAQTYNTLGSVAADLKLSGSYRGEVSGEFRGRLVLGLPERTLARLFDPQILRPEHVWRAVARVSESFDNTFGLPFLMFPMGQPQGLNQVGSVASCEMVTRSWGSFYCHYVANQLLPGLARAQASPQLSEKLAFIESFLGQGFAANKIGAELFTRVALESLLETKGRLEADDLAIWIQVRQSHSTAAEFNPTIKYGNSELIQTLATVLAPW